MCDRLIRNSDDRSSKGRLRAITATASLLAAAATVAAAIAWIRSIERTERPSFLSTATPWFVERWSPEGPVTEMFAMDADVAQVQAAACGELSARPIGSPGFVEFPRDERHGLIEILSSEKARQFLLFGAKYPPLPRGTKTLVWITTDRPGWSVQFRAWLCLKQWPEGR
jgi:hypothetical protein